MDLHRSGTQRSHLTRHAKRSHHRREANLDAATEAFVRHGYRRANLRDIIRAGGGSSQTLYRQFGSKEELFRAVMKRSMERGFDHYLTDGFADGPVREELIKFGIDHLSSFVQPDILSLFKIMIVESQDIPESCRAIWAYGPAAMENRLTTYFQRQTEAGLLDISDAAATARVFKEMVLGGLRLKALFTGVRPSSTEIESYVSSAVDTFLVGASPKTEDETRYAKLSGAHYDSPSAPRHLEKISPRQC